MRDKREAVVYQSIHDGETTVRDAREFAELFIPAGEILQQGSQTKTPSLLPA